MTDAVPTPETDDPLQDDVLRRALLHAPDHATTPDWRLRKAILQKAHEAVAVTDAALLEREEKSPWWRTLWWGGDGGARMPWNAAFATVLVATLVTVLWQREPVPGARPDREKQTGAPLPSPSASANAPSTAARRSEPAPAAGPPPAALAASQPVPSLLPELQPTEPPPPPSTADDAVPANNIALFGPDLSDTAKKNSSKASSPAEAAAPVRPAPAPVRPSAPSAATALRPAVPAPRADRARREEQGGLMPRFAAPAGGPFATTAPPAALGAANESAARTAPSAAPSARTDATEPPTFEALSQWTRITITQRGGATRSLTRAEAGALDALMGSAAISAVGAQPLTGAPEWRVTLERGKDVLAVFELGRNQVRWREGRSPPATGTPSAPALDALRGALREAVQPPSASPQPEAAKPGPAPAGPSAPAAQDPRPAEPRRTP